MLDDAMTLDRLDTNETAVITAIRLWRNHPDTTPSCLISEAAQKEIAVFVDLLWRADPYAVNIGWIFERDLRLFEVQLLYVIAEQLGGKTGSVNEILGWWFPSSEEGAARNSLAKITHFFAALNISLGSVGWIRAHLLTMSARRVKLGSQPEPRIMDMPNSYENVSTTVH